MPNTPTYSLAYPSGSDSPSGPTAFGNLASSVDTALSGMDVGSDPQYGRGLLGIAQLSTPTVFGGSSAVDVINLRRLAPINRRIRIIAVATYEASGGRIIVAPSLFMEWTGGVATTGSYRSDQGKVELASAGDFGSLTLEYTASFSTDDQVLDVLLAFARSGGTTGLARATSATLTFEDVGSNE